MIVTTRNIDQVLNISIPLDFKPDLGREDSLREFEAETLRDIINPIENYETCRFIHKPYSGLTINPNDKQCDIWYQFYFYNNETIISHDGGMDYNLVGISDVENSRMLKQSIKSFFRLEFYKTPEGESPERTNRRLVFAKNLSLPIGERVLKQINLENGDALDDYDLVYVPIFTGSNYKNKENMYFFWFQDDSALTESILTGNTFFMTARFFNSDSGTIINFANKEKSTNDQISENNDLYFEVVIDKTDYTYQIFRYDGVRGERIGQTGDPIKFYEINSAQ